MILNKKDTIDFLNGTSLHPRKGDMKTILDMVHIGKQVGYQITKIGIDQYEILPNYFITNFNKPVMIHKDIPENIGGVLDGKPWVQIFDDIFNVQGFSVEDIVYLFGLNTGDFIDISKISQYGLACAQFAGYIYEDEAIIHIYYYPHKVDQGYFDWGGKLYEWK